MLATGSGHGLIVDHHKKCPIIQSSKTAMKKTLFDERKVSTVSDVPTKARQNCHSDRTVNAPKSINLGLGSITLSRSLSNSLLKVVL